MSKQQELLDQFAMQALNALIAKLPLYDNEGEFGIPIADDKMQEIKKGIAETAYGYAGWMMIARENSKKWLKVNIDNNVDFGS